jgi:hypothetical protein
LLLSRKLHVDPSKLYAAWAVTTNKSMGGECRNVGVYIPRRIEMSQFDRSNLYVAVSRPTHFLCVIGTQPDIDTLVMRDPRPIQSGLLHRLRQASVLSDDPEMRARTLDTVCGIGVCNWKLVNPLGEDGFEMEMPDDFDFFDQSGRTAYPKPTPACPMSYLDFRRHEKNEQKRMSPEAVKDAVRGVITRYFARLYAGITDNAKKKKEPQVEVIDDDEDDEDEDATPMESAAKKVRFVGNEEGQ